ncbi:MAG: hypothetical protein OXR73_31995 [Myxococcales bacterium]|nr:hypothetical protein [Myxococcales bacterium]
MQLPVFIAVLVPLRLSLGRFIVPDLAGLDAESAPGMASTVHEPVEGEHAARLGDSLRAWLG